MAKSKKPAAKGKHWTVMLYMAAEKDEQTEQAAIRDIEELEKVGSTKDLNILVQIDRRWPGYAERYYVEEGFSTPCPIENAQELSDSAKPEVLAGFLEWGRKTFPAEYVLLVLWGHTFGLGFGRDHDDSLTLREIRDALKDPKIPVAKDRHAVDILGANACAMSYAECAYELQDAADFLLAPEIAMPFAGWPYDRILSDIKESPAIKPAALGKRIIERFMASFEEAFDRSDVSLTLLSLPNAESMREPLASLRDALTTALGTPGRNLDQLRGQIVSAFLDTSHGDLRPLIDLADLCERLAAIDTGRLGAFERTDAVKVKNAATAFSALLKQGGPLVVAHDASEELEGIHGVGIFAPAVIGASELIRFDESKKEYEKLGLVKDTKWGTIAYEQLADLLDPINRSVAEFVNGTGATDRQDRLGLALLLVSIHSAFLRLEKALTDSQEDVVRIFKGGSSAGRINEVAGQRVKRSLAGKTFGPPFLNLATNGRQTAPWANAAAQKIAQSQAGNLEPENLRLLLTVEPLSKLEDALANLERTAKRVMTHSRLGLGEGEPKAGLGEGEPKAGLGEGEPKAGLGEGEPKADLGLFAFVPAAYGYAASINGSGNVTEFYRRVARSLRLLEDGVAKLESDIQTAMTTTSNGSKNTDFTDRQTDHLNRSFRGLRELVSNARLTVGAVLADPSYGLGPSSPGSSRRQQLAIAGGLSSSSLRLL